MDDYPKMAPPPAEKSSAAKPTPKKGGGGEVKSTDWYEQSEPHPQPPGTGAAPPQKPVPKAAPVSPAALPLPPGAPYAAGTPIVVTPYKAAGKPSFFKVGNVVVGSEEGAAMALKNILFLPSIPAQS